jgi:hypothetical protein
MKGGLTRGRRVVAAFASVCAIAALVLPGAGAVKLPIPAVSVEGEATVRPQTPSRTAYHPVVLRLASRILPIKGGRLPQIESLRFGLDPDIRLEVGNARTCSRSDILGARGLSQECRRAIIGTGVAWLQEEGGTVVRLRLTLFKGGEAGREAHLLVGAGPYADRPEVVAIGRLLQMATTRQGVSIDLDLTPLQTGALALQRITLKFGETHPSDSAAAVASARCSSGSRTTEVEAQLRPLTGETRGERVASKGINSCPR